MSSSAPTPWSLLNVEGSDDASDDEVQDVDAAESAESSILSPASRRAKKRQAAARNKKAKMEAKQQQEQKSAQTGAASKNGSGNAAQSKSASASKPSTGSASSNGLPPPPPRTSSLSANGTNGTFNKSLPPAPPTFVDLNPAQVNGASSSSGSSAKLGDPFLRQSGSSSSFVNGSGNQKSLSSGAGASDLPTLVDDSASVATETEDEDTSLLIDEDDDSSYASEGDDDGDQVATPAVDERDRVLAEPATPRPSTSTGPTEATQTKAGSTIRNAAADLKLKTNAALDSISRSDAVPAGVQNLAEKARDSNLLKPEEAAAATAQPYGSDHDPSKKWKSVVTRTVWTLVMVFGFFGLMTLGHVWLIILVMFCQAAVFKEISALFDVAAKPVHSHGHHHHSKSQDKAISPTRAARDARARAERERWSKVTSWYFFAATNYFLHGETIIYYFKHIVFVDAYFIPFARHHRFISFMLYTLGFVGFVTNLKRNQLRRQFGLFCWIHMSLLLIVVSSHFIVNNILEGIIWFWLPASLVVVNDIAAYVWGMLFGRTQLIKLSPKKTVEGFVGAAFTTVVFAYFWATIFMRFNYMICPATDLGTNAFSSIECQPNDAFIWRYFSLPQEVTSLLSVVYPVEQVPWAPFQFHSVIMGIFASLVAPFGGFFASGFKRAFNVKDFGDSIPGHGGMTDRMDCQFLMGLFAYVYYSSIIRDNHVTVGQVMQTIVSSLSQQEQAELAKALAGYLAQQGVKWK